METNRSGRAAQDSAEDPVVRKTPKNNLASYVGAALCLVMIAAIPASAQDSAEQPGKVLDEEKTIDIGVGRSKLIEAPWPTVRVSITEPATAGVQVLTPRQLLLSGKAVGTTDLILWSADERVWHAKVQVLIDLTYIQQELRKFFPDADLTVTQSQDVLLVSGRLRRSEEAQHLHRMLEAYKIEYVDATRIAGVHQVMLQVRVAEVSRTAIRALGVNAIYAGNDAILGLTLGTDGGGPLNPLGLGIPAGGAAAGNLPFNFINDTTVSSAITLFGAFPGIDLALFLQALAENQYIRILAEPTLIAMSGEEASFLAGGEFPVPIVQGGSFGAGTSISIEYKEFGVRLAFKPVVLGDGIIHLRVTPEVSELSDFGAVEIEGFRIPTLLTRRASTTLELKSGQTIVMAGLLSESTTARRTKIPILGDLPVLGPLFRSVRYQNNETELVVTVTATLVEPSSHATARPVPGDLHVPPSDWDLYINGRIEGEQSTLDPADAQWLKQLGMDRLKGPGAWTTHEQRLPVRGDVPRPAEWEANAQPERTRSELED